MASRKIFFGSKPNYIYPTMEFDDANLINNPSSDHNRQYHHHNLFEFDEADIWNNNNNNNNNPNDQAMENKKPLPSSRAPSKKQYFRSGDHHHRGTLVAPASASLPVNIPDWSKILKAEYREHGKSDEDGDVVDGGDDDDDFDLDGKVPPHEYLARRRGASFSVHEGVGRTLKGRDLRRVRNAVWQKTGFED